MWGMTMDRFASPADNSSHLHLRAGNIVVDLGAGSGHYTFEVAKKLKELDAHLSEAHAGSVYAVDVQKNLLEKIKQETHRLGLGNVSVIWGDVDVAGGSKLANHIADSVIVSNVLFQSEHKKEFLEEANRLLKPGGEMLIIDWQDKLKVEDILSIIPKNLSKLEQFDAGSHHFGLIFKKS